MPTASKGLHGLDAHQPLPSLGDLAECWALGCPLEAVVLVEQPDRVVALGLLPAYVSTLAEKRQQQQESDESDDAAMRERLLQEDLRLIEAGHYACGELRKRKLVFLVMLTGDFLYFAALLIYQVTGYTTFLDYNALPGASLPLICTSWHNSMRLELMVFALVIDFVGLIAGLQPRTPVVSLFLLLHVLSTVVLSLRSATLFVVWRAAQLACGLWLRSAIQKHQMLVASIESSAPASSEEGVFMSLRQVAMTMRSFFSLLLGLEEHPRHQQDAASGPDAPTQHQDQQQLEQPSAASQQQQQQQRGQLQSSSPSEHVARHSLDTLQLVPLPIAPAPMPALRSRPHHALQTERVSVQAAHAGLPATVWQASIPPPQQLHHHQQLLQQAAQLAPHQQQLAALTPSPRSPYLLQSPHASMDQGLTPMTNQLALTSHSHSLTSHSNSLTHCSARSATDSPPEITHAVSRCPEQPQASQHQHRHTAPAWPPSASAAPASPIRAPATCVTDKATLTACHALPLPSSSSTAAIHTGRAAAAPAALAAAASGDQQPVSLSDLRLQAANLLLATKQSQAQHLPHNSSATQQTPLAQALGQQHQHQHLPPPLGNQSPAQQQQQQDQQQNQQNHQQQQHQQQQQQQHEVHVDSPLRSSSQSGPSLEVTASSGRGGYTAAHDASVTQDLAEAAYLAGSLLQRLATNSMSP
ncbi:hypothetical protein QJQ45_018470 [Haematococcus lacustris]|nr:hypothetical protein QJQ45_018470 [Haematococcus lacustris]